MKQVSFRIKQLIVATLRYHCEEAQKKFITAQVERVAQVASANCWDELNPDDGVGGRSANPYGGCRIQSADESVERERINSLEFKEAYEFAVDTFLGDSPQS